MWSRDYKEATLCSLAKTRVAYLCGLGAFFSYIEDIIERKATLEFGTKRKNRLVRGGFEGKKVIK